MDKIFFIFASLLYIQMKTVSNADILVILPLSSRSHFKSFQPLFEELIERRHNLTIISGFNLNDRFESNYRHIDVKKHFQQLKLVFADLRKQNRIQNFIFCSNFAQDYIEKILESSEIQGIINNSDHEYDLVIAEMFYYDAIFAFGYKFNAPIIALSPQTMASVYNWILGNPFPSSYVPNSCLPLTQKMSLTSRIVNTAFNFFTVLFYEFVSLPRSQTQIEKYFHFNKGDVPHIKDIMKNISVTFVNWHYSFGYPKPELPNIVNVAGLHFTPLKPLPMNIQKFMDGAQNGVVYLSLGSLIEPDNLEFLGKIFVSIFKDIPQRVVMKWNPKLLSSIPRNIMVQEWVSQIEILNHPNCRLFITHGGFHSVLESLNASVPLIGIPFFSDQQYNMAVADFYELGETLLIEDISTKLSSKIDTILHNPKILVFPLISVSRTKNMAVFISVSQSLVIKPNTRTMLKYKQNIEKRSLLFRERLTNPLDTAMFWIDHVIRHKNVNHLKPASSYLTWYELFSLDVLAIVVASILLAIYIVKFIFRIITKVLIYKKNQLHSKINSGSNDNLKYD